MLIGGLDFETTGLLEPQHRIIEACVVTYDYSAGVATKLNTYTQRINPGRSIDAKAQAVHKISEADLADEPNFAAIGNKLASMLGDCDIVVAHNGLEFDFPFLIQELERAKLDIPDFIPFDTMVEGRWATALGNVPNLGALAWASGVTYDGSEAHAAEYDVNVMMDSFFYGLKRGVFTLPALTAS